MHLQLSQTHAGKWQARIMLRGRETFAGTGEYPTRVALDDDLARMAKALGDEGAARIPVVTMHEHGGDKMLRDVFLADVDYSRSDGALHAVAGATEFASLADWLPAGE